MEEITYDLKHQEEVDVKIHQDSVGQSTNGDKIQYTDPEENQQNNGIFNYK